VYQPTYHRAGLLASALLSLHVGCSASSPYEVSVKNAYIMYSEQRESLGPPSSQWVAFVDCQIGRDRFVEDLTHFVLTKYAPEAIYGIGSFGGVKHICLVARALSNPDPEVRRVALASLCRLSGHEFRSVDDALEWWKANEAQYDTSTTERRDDAP